MSVNNINSILPNLVSITTSTVTDSTVSSFAVTEELINRHENNINAINIVPLPGAIFNILFLSLDYLIRLFESVPHLHFLATVYIYSLPPEIIHFLQILPTSLSGFCTGYY